MEKLSEEEPEVFLKMSMDPPTRMKERTRFGWVVHCMCRVNVRSFKKAQAFENAIEGIVGKDTLLTKKIFLEKVNEIRNVLGALRTNTLCHMAIAKDWHNVGGVPASFFDKVEVLYHMSRPNYHDFPIIVLSDEPILMRKLKQLDPDIQPHHWAEEAKRRWGDYANMMLWCLWRKAFERS